MSSDEAKLAQEASEELEATTSDADAFKKAFETVVNPRTDDAREEASNAVSAFVKQAMENQAVVSDDLMDTIATLTSAIDSKLTAQVNEILHNEEFKQLESAWTGLEHLVVSADPDSTTKVKVLNVSKDELREELMAPGGMEQRPLYKKIYSAEYNSANGNPYGVLIGDYQFDNSDGDVTVLTKIGEIAQSAHAPFLSSAAPGLMGFDDFSELTGADKLDFLIPDDSPEYAKWFGLRDNEISRYIALTAPNVMARSPYGPNSSKQVKEFDFVEDVDGHDNKKYAWMNSAFAMGANIAKAHKEHGWTTRIRGVRSGGMVKGLPMHVFETGGGQRDAKCPIQVAMDNDREAEFSSHGLIGLQHRKNTDTAAFIGAQTLYKPSKGRTDEEKASDRLSARLPYIFAVSRFSHYLKMMIHDMVGESKEHEQLERELTSWIKKYIPANPSTASEAEKARKPLADARVEVVEDEENPGYYHSRFYLRPHFQLEGMTVGMTLVSKMPDPK